MTNLPIHPSKLILGILTPFITAGSAWLVAAVAKYGLTLDKGQVTALGIAGATAGGAACLKLIHDLEHRYPALTRLLEQVPTPGVTLTAGTTPPPPPNAQTPASSSTPPAFAGWPPEDPAPAA